MRWPSESKLLAALWGSSTKPLALLRRIKRPSSQPFLQINGFCPACDQKVTFFSKDSWLRDHFLCSNCGSIPRERALMYAIEMYYPNFRDLIVHESSPIGRGASTKLARECKHYSSSFYDPLIPFGAHHPTLGYRSENLENMTFKNESFDLMITQDVFEHIFNPEKAFSEVARVLKPGGAHIFTTPLVNQRRPSERCAILKPDGTIEHLKQPEYHGNPIDSKGSLVTVQWGYDICERIYRASGLFTTVLKVDHLEMGIRAELNEVLISFKHISVVG